MARQHCIYLLNLFGKMISRKYQDMSGDNYILDSTYLDEGSFCSYILGSSPSYMERIFGMSTDKESSLTLRFFTWFTE